MHLPHSNIFMSQPSEIFRLQQAKAIEWRKEPVSERKKRLRKIHKWILGHRIQICEAVHADFKKPFEEVQANDIFPVTSEINHILAHLDDWTKPKKVDTPLTLLGTWSEVRYEPRGVCLVIAPWNFPFNLAIGPLVSALSAGNTVVLKPSEITPSTSALITQMIDELFRPEEVSVFEGGAEISTELLSLPFDHIFFTGSPAVGKIVMKAAAQHLSSVTLELGGKSPVIIHEDADAFHAAQQIAFSKFLNNGQTCIAPDYVVVHEKVQSDFLKHLKKETLRMFGNRTSVTPESVQYGRIANHKNFMRLRSVLEQATADGWTPLLEGALDYNSRFFHPTILTGNKFTGSIMEEEIFGPILPVIPYQNLDQVISEINRRPKPLALYVFSNSKKISDAIAQQTSAGGICFNGCLVQFIHPNLPFGGVNNSGIGKSHGHHGFIAFSNEKAVVRRRVGFASTSLFHPPYPKWFNTIIGPLLKWF